MNSPNQDKPESNSTYDPNVAVEFFERFGKLESVKAGKKLFEQGQKANFLSFLQTEKTYLLVEGKVAIQTAAGNAVDIELGEIFGEFTPYKTSNATAVANSACKVLTLSEKQLLAGLEKKPEFLFMLMDVLIKNLHKVGNEGKKEDTKLSASMLDELKAKLGDSALTVVPEKRVLFQKGASALLMYVILDGQMIIGVDNKVVGRSGPGDIVGEIALVTPQHSRTASVVTETRCSLLAINRPTLLELIQSMPAFGMALLRVVSSR